MENIILLMLFTYPGAVAYLIYEQLTKNKTYYKDADSFSKTALCFFVSAGITILTCQTIAKTGEMNLTALTEQMKTSSAIWRYLIFSLLYSTCAGVVGHLLLKLHFALYNKHRSKHKLSPYSDHPKVWAQLVKEYDLTDCAAIIRKGGRIVRAGMPEILPDDIDNDRQIVLSYCDRVEAELAKPDRGLLGERFVSVYDLASDTEIEFIASQALDEAIRKDLANA